jgi:hypothetical protein
MKRTLRAAKLAWAPEMTRDSSSMASTGVLLAVVIAGQRVMAIVFIGLFRWIQRTFTPAGRLEAIDMTRYAHRDTALVVSFGVVLVVFVAVCTWRARGTTARITVCVAGAVVAFIIYVTTFFGVMTP